MKQKLWRAATAAVFVLALTTTQAFAVGCNPGRANIAGNSLVAFQNRAGAGVDYRSLTVNFDNVIPYVKSGWTYIVIQFDDTNSHAAMSWGWIIHPDGTVWLERTLLKKDGGVQALSYYSFGTLMPLATFKIEHVPQMFFSDQYNFYKDGALLYSDTFSDPSGEWSPNEAEIRVLTENLDSQWAGTNANHYDFTGAAYTSNYGGAIWNIGSRVDVNYGSFNATQYADTHMGGANYAYNDDPC